MYFSNLSGVTIYHNSSLDFGLGVVATAFGLLTSSLYYQHLTAPIGPMASNLSLYLGHKNSGFFLLRFGTVLPLSLALTYEIISRTSSRMVSRWKSLESLITDLTILTALALDLSVWKYFLSSASCNSALSCKAKLLLSSSCFVDACKAFYRWPNTAKACPYPCDYGTFASSNTFDN